MLGGFIRTADQYALGTRNLIRGNRWIVGILALLLTFWIGDHVREEFWLVVSRLAEGKPAAPLWLAVFAIFLFMWAAIAWFVSLTAAYTPRAWGRLVVPPRNARDHSGDSQEPSVWVYRVDGTGGIVASRGKPVLWRKERLKRIWRRCDKLPSEDPATGASLEISPDGTILATTKSTAGGTNSALWTLSPEDGKHFLWQELISVGATRILAIAPRGDSDAWLAIMNGAHIHLLPASCCGENRGLGVARRYQALIQVVGEPPFIVLGEKPCATIVGQDLLCAGGKGSNVPEGLMLALREAPTGASAGELNRKAQKAIGNEKVIAIDSARYDGEYCLTTLTRNNESTEAYLRLFREKADEVWKKKVSLLAEHLHLVRHPYGTTDEACVLYGFGRVMLRWWPFKEQNLA